MELLCEAESVVEAVDCLTHRNGEPRNAYLRRIAENPLAVKVKLADLTHNADLSRLASPTERDYVRAARYKREMEYLRPFVSRPDCSECKL